MTSGSRSSTRATPTPGTGADRTHLLALFAPAPPLPRKWAWAVDQLVDRIGHHARSQHHAKHRPSEFIKLLAKNLDPLSRLAGFDPSDPGRSWHAHPTHALRFAEVLSKIYASHFTVGEILFLFTANGALDGDDPFPLPTEEESLDSPLDLPDDAGELSLAEPAPPPARGGGERGGRPGVDVAAHRESRCARSSASRLPRAGPIRSRRWARTSSRTSSSARGPPSAAKDRRYRVGLAATATSAAMWNAPADGPFRYDAGAQELWTEVPLQDEAVLEKLSRVRQLSGAEQAVVRELYFLPRVDLAPFAFLFPTFEEADRRLIQEADQRGALGLLPALVRALPCALPRHRAPPGRARRRGDRRRTSTSTTVMPSRGGCSGSSWRMRTRRARRRPGSPTRASPRP